MSGEEKTALIVADAFGQYLVTGRAHGCLLKQLQHSDLLEELRALLTFQSSFNTCLLFCVHTNVFRIISAVYVAKRLSPCHELLPDASPVCVCKVLCIRNNAACLVKVEEEQAVDLHALWVVLSSERGSI